MITRIKRMVRYNFPEKLIALIVAVVLWLVVMADQNPVIDGSFDVPLTRQNAPQGYRITESASTATIYVRAPRSFFINAEASSFQAFLNLDGLGEGTYPVKITPKIPQGFELSETIPATVDVTLDPFVNKQMVTELIVTGSPAPGITVARITKNMEAVTVVGPRSQIDTVTRVIGYVALSGNEKDFELEVPITAINADGREVALVRVMPETINVDVQLARGLSKKIVTVEPIFDDDADAGFEAKISRIDPAKIEIAGEVQIIGPLSSVPTEKISLKGEEKDFVKTVKLNLPDGVTVTDPNITVEVSVVNKNGANNADSTEQSENTAR